MMSSNLQGAKVKDMTSVDATRYVHFSLVTFTPRYIALHRTRCIPLASNELSLVTVTKLSSFEARGISICAFERGKICVCVYDYAYARV
jgi:hypothetical protein